MSDQALGWITPPNPSVSAEYTLTRRSADAAPGYDHCLPDISVTYRWAGSEGAWISGYYQGRQRREPNFVCLHANNGWRLA